MITAELNVLDEFYLHMDREEEAWSVHLEVAVEGRVDGERLAAAIVEGAGRHPLARARLRPTRATDVRYRWEVAEQLAAAPLTVIDAPDAAALAACRERLMSATPSLEEAPPFDVVLAHHPDGDTIMLNLSHAAGDGLSALRLMASFLRAYAGEEDPASPVDPLEVRDIGELANSRSLGARVARGRALVEQSLRSAVGSPARIEPSGASERSGYGFALMRVGGDDLKRLSAARPAGATVNDVLLGALAVAIQRWNERSDGPTRRVSLMMPVNLRPPEWRYEVVGNFASYVSVSIGADEQHDLVAASAAAARRTREIKDKQTAGLMVDLLEVPTATLPTVVKQRFQDLVTLTGNRFVDTAVLSNLGRLDAVPRLDDEAGEVQTVWFSPPGRMPLGASLGAATYGGELFLTLRYRHALFGSAAASAFCDLLRDVLTTDPLETT